MRQKWSFTGSISDKQISVHKQGKDIFYSVTSYLEKKWRGQENRLKVNWKKKVILCKSDRTVFLFLIQHVASLPFDTLNWPEAWRALSSQTSTPPLPRQLNHNHTLPPHGLYSFLHSGFAYIVIIMQFCSELISAKIIEMSLCIVTEALSAEGSCKHQIFSAHFILCFSTIFNTLQSQLALL